MTRRLDLRITDIAPILGKAPVTLRGWEREGFIKFRRNSKGDRRINIDELLEITKRAHRAGRIDDTRRDIITAVVSLIKVMERE